MSGSPIRYQTDDEDSGRWTGFPFRDDDIVISTRSKSGTTWMQMICALLIFQTADLPEPLCELSPWLDWLIEPRDDVFKYLEQQQHRRFIKTHTPLDGIPLNPGVTYFVVARHPLDMAESLYHQRNNIDHEKYRALTGMGESDKPPEELTLSETLRHWMDFDGEPGDYLDSLLGTMWHLQDAWERRNKSNVHLFHYGDLTEDLGAEMRRAAALLDIVVPEERWPALVEAATFDSMKSRAQRLAPDPKKIFKSSESFFRSGGSREWPSALTEADLAGFHERITELTSPDLAAWLLGQ